MIRDRVGAPAVQEHECVGTLPPDQHVVCAVAGQHVIACAADHVADVADPVRAGRGAQRQVDLHGRRVLGVVQRVRPTGSPVDRPGERRAVLEDECVVLRAANDLFDAGRVVQLVREVRRRNRPPCVNREHQLAGEDGLPLGNAREVQRVHTPGIAQRVHSPAVEKTERVRINPARQMVVTRTSDQHIVPGASQQRIVPEPAVQRVGAAATGNRVGLAVSGQRIPGRSADDVAAVQDRVADPSGRPGIKIHRNRRRIR